MPGCDESCLAARKAQDPLAPIAGLLTDFTSTFGPSTWSNSTRNDNYQFQPVYSLENFAGAGGNLILRGIVPANSGPGTMGSSRTTGIGDSLIQGFYVPPGQVEGGFKLGFGPQFSLPTHTDSRLEGPGWGAGGVYYLVVHPSDAESVVKMPDWLQIRSVPQMKKTLLEVIVVLLAISFLQSLVEDMDSLGWLLLLYPAAIIALAVAVRIIPFDH